MSEMKMENSRVPAEKIFNPDLKEAIVTMQEDNSKENVDKMITEVVKAKFILPAKVVPTTQAVTENGQTVMKQATQVQFRLLENQKKEKFFGLFTDTEELFKWQDTQNAQKVVTDFDSISQMVMDPHSGVVGFVINPFGKSVTFPSCQNSLLNLVSQRPRVSEPLAIDGDRKAGDNLVYAILGAEILRRMLIHGVRIRPRLRLVKRDRDHLFHGCYHSLAYPVIKTCRDHNPAFSKTP